MATCLPGVRVARMIPAKLTDNFIATEVDGEILLVDLDGGELFALRDTAAACWRLIDGSRDIDAITSLLGETYAAGAGLIEQDVRDLIRSLAEAQLVATR